MTHYKPTGYNSISPYLVVKGAQKMVDFLLEVFDGKELRRYDNKDGTIMHTEVKIDDSVIMIGDASDQWPANTHMLHVYIPDVDATFQKALDAGCKSVEEPKRKEGDPDKRGMFEDFAGNQWAVSSQL